MKRTPRPRLAGASVAHPGTAHRKPDQCRSASRAPANAPGVRSDGGRPSPSDAHTPRQNRQLPPPPLAQVNAAHQDAKHPSADRPQMILVGEAGRLYPLSWRIPPSWKMATPTSPGYAALISSHYQLSGIAPLNNILGTIFSAIGGSVFGGSSIATTSSATPMIGDFPMSSGPTMLAHTGGVIGPRRLPDPHGRPEGVRRSVPLSPRRHRR